MLLTAGACAAAFRAILAAVLTAAFTLLPTALRAEDWIERLDSNAQNIKQASDEMDTVRVGSPMAALYFKECMFREVEGACAELINQNDPAARISNWTRASAHRKRGELRERRQEKCGAVSDYRAALAYHNFPGLDSKIDALDTEAGGHCSDVTERSVAKISTTEGLVSAPEEDSDDGAYWVTTIELPPLPANKKRATPIKEETVRPHAVAAAQPAPKAAPAAAKAVEPPQKEAVPAAPAAEPQAGAADAVDAAHAAEPPQNQQNDVAAAAQKVQVADAGPPPNIAAPLETSALPAPAVAAEDGMPRVPVLCPDGGDFPTLPCAEKEKDKARAKAQQQEKSKENENAGPQTQAVPVVAVAARQDHKAARQPLWNASRSMLALVAAMVTCLGIALLLTRFSPDWPSRLTEMARPAYWRDVPPQGDAGDVVFSRTQFATDEPSFGLPADVAAMQDDSPELFDEQALLDELGSLNELAGALPESPPPLPAHGNADGEATGDVPVERAAAPPVPEPEPPATEERKAAPVVKAEAPASPALQPAPAEPGADTPEVRAASDAPQPVKLGDFSTGSRLIGLIAEGSLDSVERGTATLLAVDGEGHLTKHIRRTCREALAQGAPERLLLIEPKTQRCGGILNLFSVAIWDPDSLVRNERFNAVFELHCLVFEALFGRAFAHNNRLALRHFARLLHALPDANLRMWFDLLEPQTISRLGDYAALTEHAETLKFFRGAVRDQVFLDFAGELRGKIAQLLADPDFEHITCGAAGGVTFEQHVNSGRMIVFTHDLSKFGPVVCSGLLRTFFALIICIRPKTTKDARLKLPVCLFLDQPERLFGPQKAEYEFLANEFGRTAISVIRT